MGSVNTIIYGANLKTALSKINPALSERIDPSGLNVVAYSTLYNEDKNIQAYVLIKVLDSAEPFETLLDFPISVYNKIGQPMWNEGKDASSN